RRVRAPGRAPGPVPPLRYGPVQLPGDCFDEREGRKRRTKLRALSATSRQPPSMTSACPRLGISTISVTPSLRFCLLYEAFAIAQGTVWSLSPEMISSGPRSGFLLSTFASVQGLRLAVAAWKRGTPDAGTAKVS